MRFFTSGAFWGALIVLLGVSIILKAVFNVNIPLVRTVLGLLIVYWGISILFGFKPHVNEFKNESTIVFGQNRFESAPIQGNYNIVFGQGEIDLSKTEQQIPAEIKVDCVFGNALVYISRQTAVTIKASSAFGNIVLPEGDSVAFGEINRTIGDSEKRFRLKLNTVFGQTRVLYKD